MAKRTRSWCNPVGVGAAALLLLLCALVQRPVVFRVVKSISYHLLSPLHITDVLLHHECVKVAPEFLCCCTCVHARPHQHMLTVLHCTCNAMPVCRIYVWWQRQRCVQQQLRARKHQQHPWQGSSQPAQVAWGGGGALQDRQCRPIMHMPEQA